MQTSWQAQFHQSVGHLGTGMDRHDGSLKVFVWQEAAVSSNYVVSKQDVRGICQNAIRS
ncbi:hypothetical protein [Effusibacillus dendaii]|uniref:Uncharacterized protein n=1 Tax=Effusibacillus dendaii TaxID=2743772 RepID=A0A7I8DBM3_9BACL|nr:hypothetical protein [Effusibacillus dendaii]BCJ86359.1 hypothetical protein skT53_13440 [Effusibacillus dendaii]